MAQDNPAAAQFFGITEASLTRFKEMLSPRDQQALDELFELSDTGPIATFLADHDLPAEFLFLAVLLEHHKTLTFLIEQQSVYGQKLYFKRVKQPGM